MEEQELRIAALQAAAQSWAGVTAGGAGGRTKDMLKAACDFLEWLKEE